MPQAMKLNGKFPATPPLAQTPPCTPIDESPQHCVVHPPIAQGELKDLLLEIIREVKAAKNHLSLDPESEPADRKQASDEDQKKDEIRVRASNIEYKTADRVYADIHVNASPIQLVPYWKQLPVRQLDLARRDPISKALWKCMTPRTSWDKAKSKYKTIEWIEPDDIVDALDEYVFVVREHIDNESKESTTYIDVKSEVLRDILRGVLQDAKGINLMEDKPSIEQKTLFHFLPELCDHAEKLRVTADSKPQGLEHLLLLVRHIESAYAATKQHLTSLLRSGQISYDLLWALFKPGSHIYTTCMGTGKPRCVIFDAGEEATEKGVKYYKLECRYLDYDGQVFGEVGVEFGIIKFRGYTPIHTLDTFPLHHHPDHERVRNDLIECGRTFREVTSGAPSNTGAQLRHCKGSAFIMKNRQVIVVNIDGRVAIDATFFREMEPNYSRPRIYESWENLLAYSIISVGSEQHRKELERMKSNGLETRKMTDDDLLICCPTVRCFSFEEKCFLECAVADLHEVQWSEMSFDHLQVPEDTKRILLSLATSRLRHFHASPIDDLIRGKGCGLNVLLHGPPGVGKTFTVEATAERFNLPLYSISAGELIANHGDPLKLDLTLDRIFKIARHFNAILLLDEADVFMEKRSAYHDSHNRLVTIFLRKLEYYEGILFLTTNRLVEFDEAILSRIHLKVKYEGLTKESRREIWTYFLSKASTDKGPAVVEGRDLNRLESTVLNGRDIKNLTSIAHALATVEETHVAYKHLELAAKSNDKFLEEFNNYGRTEGLYT
ncbi:hypothetical protein EMCG_08563 [[Emmonsia] crescens]|uniref:AAA+ ATPase domain-containing protein n=1 Tax=[Emmonsia] crescens TaxID=73230 RepID=A0A0G2J469_9EURO|nr:hypothetical protein EMCG_08563 [Emmonsia crescens UAMH 3008]